MRTGFAITAIRPARALPGSTARCILPVLAGAGASLVSRAAAHEGLPPAPHDLWTSWNFSPPLLSSLGLLCVAYALGYRRCLRVSHGRHPVLNGWRAASFYAAVAALLVALVSPLDALGTSLLSAHMAQHLLLLVVAPALLVASAPGYTLTWALPRRARRGLSRALNRSTTLRAARGLWSTMASPLGALLVATGVLWAWHAPFLYQAALASEVVHVLEHASFLGSSYLFWHVLLSPLGRHRLQGGAGAAVLFGASVQGSALGALMAFSPQPWYASYAATTAAWGLTPLQDQQLAGVLMWMPLGTVYVLVACVLLWSWLRASGGEASEGRPAGSAAAAGGGGARAGVGPPRPARASGLRSGAGLVAFSTVVAVLGLALMALVVVYVLGRSASGGIAVAPSTTVEGGNAASGPELLRQYGCVTCHEVAGVRQADGMVGPPLSRLADRAVIAGRLQNTPANLIHWIRFPQEVAPGSAMPDLGVTEPHARDIAAYLYSLE